jgi:heme/copper-type cytochrome/quinol oxidase subunit 2
MSPATSLLAITDMQSALAPAGEQGANIARLWWIFFWVLIAIFGLVSLAVFLALFRPRPSARDKVKKPDESLEGRLSTVVVGSVVTTILILFGPSSSISSPAARFMGWKRETRVRPIPS